MDYHSKICPLAKLVPLLKAQNDRLEAQETALDLLKAKHYSLEAVLSSITESLETYHVRQRGNEVEAFGPVAHTPEPYDATTHHLLCGHESLRRDVEQMSMEISNLDAKTRMMVINESLHTKDELTRANAAISSIRMQLNWLTSADYQRGFPTRSHRTAGSMEASVAVIDAHRRPTRLSQSATVGQKLSSTSAPPPSPAENLDPTLPDIHFLQKSNCNFAGFYVSLLIFCANLSPYITPGIDTERPHKPDMPYPQTLEVDPKIIFFTDFDGTITLNDSNDWLTDNLGFGEKLRRQCNVDTLNDKVTFRESFWEMMESVKTPFPDCIRLLSENIKLDPYFNDFYQWSRANAVPVIVVSSGMTPIIRSLLVHLIGPEANDIEIVSNEVEDKPGKTKDQEDGWQLKYHDDSGFGHDKSLTIRPYAEHFAARPNEPRPTMLYAGDGVSDLSAARETDLLFAKKGHDLITYCEREGIPFTVFEDWQSILATTRDFLEGTKSIKSVAEEGAEKAQGQKQNIKTTK
ncbi:MAG: hypothetical protein Q9221_008210 [Calogaya cf. arnoldii]